MSNITTPDEVALVLEQAESAMLSHDGATAARLAQGVLDSGVATAHDRARASIVMAEAAFRSGSTDAANSWLQSFDAAGDSALAERARVLREEIERYHNQVAANTHGVAQGDAASVIQTANEALGQSDGWRAEQVLLPAYQSGGLTAAQAGDVAVLLAKAVLLQGRSEDAEQYAGYAVSVGASGAEEVLQQAKAMTAANTASGDGTDATEAAAVFEQAKQAMYSTDFTDALRLFTSVHASASAPGALRARAAFNAAVANAGLNDTATARQWIEAAVALGMDASKVQQLTTNLEHREAALALVD
jgi:hypothetical protein